MKLVLYTLIAVILPSLAFAQSGNGFEFHYDGFGNRIQRNFSPTASYQKPGKDNFGQQADTMVGVFKNYDTTQSKPDKIFVRAYPNPVQDVLFVENVDWESGKTAMIRLTDISGKLISTKKSDIAKERINFQNVPPGTYTIKYYLDGAFIISWKIVKL